MAATHSLKRARSRNTDAVVSSGLLIVANEGSTLARRSRVPDAGCGRGSPRSPPRSAAMTARLPDVVTTPTPLLRGRPTFAKKVAVSSTSSR